MRIYRYDKKKDYWETIQSQGINDSNVWVIAFTQALRMQPTESPFFANVGLGSVQAVQDQQDPDEDIARMTSLYSIHFASLKVQKTRTADEVNPVYNYEIITLEGNNYSGYVTSDGGYNDK